MPRSELFPPIDPFQTGVLPVDDIHTLYWEQSGNPRGVPVLFLHGGPGSGTGGGTRPLWVSGTIRDKDYPRPAARAKVGGEVEVRFTVEPSGRVTGCRVSRSSGDLSLDATTCRLIEERFRFKPATDGRGTPVTSQYGWRQTWWLEPRR